MWVFQETSFTSLEVILQPQHNLTQLHFKTWTLNRTCPALLQSWHPFPQMHNTFYFRHSLWENTVKMLKPEIQYVVWGSLRFRLFRSSKVCISDVSTHTAFAFECMLSSWRTAKSVWRKDFIVDVMSVLSATPAPPPFSSFSSAC